MLHLCFSGDVNMLAEIKSHNPVVVGKHDVGTMALINMMYEPHT